MSDERGEETKIITINVDGERKNQQTKGKEKL
jgi:hypothetical protein